MTMAIINSIYEKSPYFIKVISLNLYSIRQKSINYGPLAKSRLKELTAFDINNKFAVRSYQERQLKKMLTYAKVNVPYYKDISIDFPKKSPQDFFKWFYSEIPLLNKATVKDDPQRFYANNMDEGRPLFFHTSGTSGSPMTIKASRQSRTKNYVFYRHLLNKFGVDITDRSVTFAGRNLIQEKNQISIPDWWGNTLYCSSYHISEKNFKLYTDKIESWRPEYIDAYPSALFSLALLARKFKFKFKHHPKVILTSSETLLPSQRELIEDVFGCAIVDQYGCTEMSVFAANYTNSSYLPHPLFGITEVLGPDEKQVEPGERGEIVTTGFINKYMPLIRYKIGDIGCVAEDNDDREYRRSSLRYILGRLEDSIITPEGKRVGRLDPIFKGLSHVINSQIIQSRETELIVKVVIDPQASNIEPMLRQLEKNLRARTSQEFNIKIECVDHIKKDANGKFRAVISHVT